MSRLLGRVLCALGWHKFTQKNLKTRLYLGDGRCAWCKARMMRWPDGYTTKWPPMSRRDTEATAMWSAVWFTLGLIVGGGCDAHAARGAEVVGATEMWMARHTGLVYSNAEAAGKARLSVLVLPEVE